MFGVPVERHGINSHLRQKGKIVELVLGYGGSVVSLKSMGALEMGITEEELQPLINSWHNSNPMIIAFWWDIDRAVKPLSNSASKPKYTESITYESIGSTKKWERIESYGPKFVENIVQAVSRDTLLHADGYETDWYCKD